MTDDDLANIERSLGVTLPDDYRRIALNYPVRFNAGRGEGEFWDNAERLIEENRRYRSESNWPENFFFVGDDGAGWQYAIDLSADPPHVVLVEYGDMSTAGSISPEFDRSEPMQVGDWFHACLKRLRDDGVDIAADEWPPPESWTSRFGCVAVGFVFCVLVAVIGVLVVQGINSLFGR